MLGRVRGAIDCRGCRVTMGSDPCTFVVYTQDRDLTLRAENRADAYLWADAITCSGRAGLNLLEPIYQRAIVDAGGGSSRILPPPMPPLARQAPASAREMPPLPPDENSAPHRPPWNWLLHVASELATLLSCTVGGAAYYGGRELAALCRAVPGKLGELAQDILHFVCRMPGPQPTLFEADTCCVVCMDAEPTHALIPCGHRCVCGSCARRLDSCPLCRKRSTSSLRIYA